MHIPRLRAASLLSILTFLAFGFQVVGVFSEPVSRRKLPIATRGKYNYGVLGWCPRIGECSGYGVGYTFQDSETSRWSENQQQILSDIMIVHIIAAGMLLMALFMSVCTHIRSRPFWICVETWFCLCFLVSTLSFIVEIVLFGKSLQFAGWFALAAAILSLCTVFAMAAMLSNLHPSPKHEPDSLLNPSGVFLASSGNDFRDDEKLLKDNVRVTELPPLPSKPVLKTTSVFHGYQKVPESKKDMVSKNESVLPVSPSSDSIGAQKLAQKWQNGQAQQRYAPYEKESDSSESSSSGQSQASLQQRQQRQLPQQPRQDQGTKPKRESDTMSIASTNVKSFPAGMFVRDLNKQNGKPTTSVVKIPKVREPESAIIEYDHEETQSKSPVIGQEKVPNYSRFGSPKNKPAPLNTGESRNVAQNDITSPTYSEAPSSNYSSVPSQMDNYYVPPQMQPVPQQQQYMQSYGYYQPYYTAPQSYGFQPTYGYQAPMQYQAMTQPPTQRAPRPQPQPRSEMALNSNPDFAIPGGRRRPGNRRM